jgi:hypothetical protein
MIPTSKYNAGPLLARRSRRRVVVILYWAFVAPLTVFVVGRFFSRPTEFFFILLPIVLVLNLVTLTRWMTKPFGWPQPLHDPEAITSLYGDATAKEIFADTQFDEREARERDRVHFFSYRFVLWFSILWFVLLAVAEFFWPAEARWLGPVFLAGLVALIIGLPQSLILWKEPDVEADI